MTSAVDAKNEVLRSRRNLAPDPSEVYAARSIRIALNRPNRNASRRLRTESSIEVSPSTMMSPENGVGAR